MRKRFTTALAIFCLAFSSGTFAAWSMAGVSISCSTGDFSSLSDEGFAASCGGDFSLSGGTLFSDAWIKLTAGGSLQFDDIKLIAPDVTLRGGDIKIVNGSLPDVAAGRISIVERGDIVAGNPGWIPGRGQIIVSQVPEAPVQLMWLLGVGILAGLRRRRVSHRRQAGA